MNLSLKLFLASIVGPCLLAFTVGYFSRPFVSSYHHYLALSINEAFKSSSLKIILPFVVHVSFHSDSANPERLQTIRWSHYLGESGSNPTEVPVNEKFQNDAAESAKTVSSGSQRVFVDLINLDSEFLNSEEMVETGFLTLVKQLRMKNFTYECHRRLSGKGVNCMGYAGQDSISVYTWPSLGVLSLNVLSSLHDPWGSAIPLAKEIFAVPIASPELNFREPCLTWSLKQRNTGKLSWMTYKPVPPNPSTAYDPSGIDSYETIDGVDIKPMSAPPLEVKNDTQRQQNYDIIYSEALVHPVMFAHDNPKRVAIVGNGTGSTLREVLKHKTVEKVVLVGSDSSVLQTSRKLFPQHSDCSTLKGSAQCCYDDARVEMISDETVEWLLGEEGDDGDVSPDDQFDVIIFEKK